MELDFYLQQIDDYTIKVLDNTLVNQIDPLGDIFQMSLDIIGAKVPNGGIYSIDCIPYIVIHKKNKEIYEINSSVLNLGNTQVIPDGVYTINWTINNYMSKTHKFIVYSSIKKRVDALIAGTGYKVTIGNYDITYTGDNCKGDIEQVRLAVSLLDTLQYAANTGNEVLANDTLDKLNRILLILKY